MSTGIDWGNDILQMMVIDDEFAKTITWNGGSYTCLLGALETDYSLETIGIRTAKNFQVIVLKSAFTSTQPAVGDKITYSSSSYRITKIDKDPTGSWYLMQINEETK